MPSLATPAVPPGSMAALPQPAIRAEGLLLRPWQAADAPVVVVAYADPDIQRWHCRSMTDDEARARHAGFPAEGTRRGAARHADGWHDMHLYARLASDR